MAMIVVAIVSVLVWGIVTDKTRVLALARSRRRIRVQGRVTPRQPAPRHVSASRRQYGHQPGFSA